MKDKIINGLKLFLLIFIMVMGFYFTYGLILSLIGLQLTEWVIMGILALSMISEVLYIKWVSV